MSISITPLLGVELNTPTPPFILGTTPLTNSVGSFTEGGVVTANDGRRYVYGQCSTAVPVGATTIAIVFTAGTGGNGVQNVSFAATGGTGVYAISLPSGASGQAAAINDFIWVGVAQAV